jgi:23S rRNA A2030 N6-methylase RlmJ
VSPADWWPLIAERDRYKHALEQIESGHDWDAVTGLYEGSPRLSRRAMREKARRALADKRGSTP